MTKKKKIIFLIIVLLLIFFCCFGFFEYKKNEYDLEKVRTILNEGKKLPDNVKIKMEIFTGENDTYAGSANTYIKDNLVYTHQTSSEGKVADVLFDYNAQSLITIIHYEKIITALYNMTDLEKTEANMINNFDIMVDENKSKFEYLGKEKINKKECIKVSLTHEYLNGTEGNYTSNVEKNYYYINLEDKHIVKVEFWKGANLNELSKLQVETYEYSYNTVTDDDILKFDKTNYPDYEYIENDYRYSDG